MSGLFSRALDGIAHGYCLLWDQSLLWLHAGSDSLIAAAYFAIPFTLVRFIRARRDVPFNAIFLWFGAFILLCGTTHVLGVWNIWVPDWWVSGTVKAATAVVSIVTAVLLVRLMPQALALPSPAQLRAANAELEATNVRLTEEIRERRLVEAQLERAHAETEALVERRTAELAEANARLQASEARYKALVSASADLVWTARTDGVVDDIEAWAPFTGALRDGETPRDLIHPEEQSWVLDDWRTAVQTEQPYDCRHRMRRPDGSWRHVHVRAVPVRDDDGAVHEWIGVHEDISDRVETERQIAVMQEQLQQAQRLEAVGRLAGGIAHDFNNLLTVISGAGGLLLETLEPEHPARQDAQDIVTASARAAALTAQLLAYSRKQVMQPRRLNLFEAVHGVDGMIRRLIGTQVTVDIRPPDEPLWTIEADPHQLEQVILNLAVNARDAMPDGGTLTIETANVTISKAYTDTHLGVIPGSYVMMAVSDTGVGMDEFTRSQIFEPFFTTKARGQGTGLGLATVYGIVRQSRGYIYVYSEPGHGTTFKLYFPRVDGATDADGVPLVPPVLEAVGGREGILLVDDSDDVRLFVTRILERAGYKVTAVSGGEAALELLRADARVVDLLLTDVVMPAMNGRELARAVGELRPGAMVLYMSGFTDNAIVANGMLDPGTNFIAKPFSPDQLLTEIRRVLGARPSQQQAG